MSGRDPRAANDLGGGLYDDAVVYDTLHTPGSADEAGAVEAVVRAVSPDAGRGVWLEAACGTGRLLRVLARRGRRIAGFDASPVMVREARTRLARLGHGAEIFEARMESFGDDTPRGLVGRVGVCFSTINTVRHLMSDGEVLAFLSHVHACLTPGGVCVLGLGVCDPAAERITEDVWSARRGSLEVAQTVQYLPPSEIGVPRRERVISRVEALTDTATRSIDSVYELRTYTLGQWRSVLGRSTLTLRGAFDDDGNEIDPPAEGYALWALMR